VFFFLRCDELLSLLFLEHCYHAKHMQHAGYLISDTDIGSLLADEVSGGCPLDFGFDEDPLKTIR
jgi:hypothetical protein